MSEDMTWTPDKVEALAKELGDYAKDWHLRASTNRPIVSAASALTWALELIAAVEKDKQDAIKQRDQQYGRAEVAIEERDAANARAGAAEEMLRQIGDYAHDKSTGPAVPDALWEIREMAYGTIREVGK